MLDKIDSDIIIRSLYGDRAMSLKQFWIIENKIDKQEDRDLLSRMLFTYPKPTLDQTNEFLKRNTLS